MERRRKLVAIANLPEDDAFGGELVLGADQFIVRPAGRVEESARARASGDDVRTVIAGYHWFTDWGRDTMISLEGLTLSTHRYREAGYILRTFAHYVRDGLIPNMFPDGEREGLYHTADATLWFFHAIERYTVATGDDETVRKLMPVLLDIIQHHLRGTRFGIRIDPADGLFTQGAGGLSADVDGRQGRRLGRDAAARQGRRAERPLVQRAVPDAVVDASSSAAATGPEPRGTRAARARVVQQAVLVRAGWIPLRRRRRRARGRHQLPAEPGVRDLAAASRSSIASAGSP